MYADRPDKSALLELSIKIRLFEIEKYLIF